MPRFARSPSRTRPGARPGPAALTHGPARGGGSAGRPLRSRGIESPGAAGPGGPGGAGSDPRSRGAPAAPRDQFDVGITSIAAVTAAALPPIGSHPLLNGRGQWGRGSRPLCPPPRGPSTAGDPLRAPPSCGRARRGHRGGPIAPEPPAPRSLPDWFPRGTGTRTFPASGPALGGMAGGAGREGTGRAPFRGTRSAPRGGSPADALLPSCRPRNPPVSAPKKPTRGQIRQTQLGRGPWDSRGFLSPLTESSVGRP